MNFNARQEINLCLTCLRCPTPFPNENNNFFLKGRISNRPGSSFILIPWRQKNNPGWLC